MRSISLALLHAAWIITLLAGCSQPPPRSPGVRPRDPTPLIDGLVSYATIDDTATSLAQRAGWTIVEESSIPARGACPGFRILRTSLPWSHLGSPGELRLGFVNGMLFETIFFPEDAKGHREVLFKAGAPSNWVKQGNAYAASLSPRTRVWSAPAFDGRWYVRWADQAVLDEFDAWLAACS